MHWDFGIDTEGLLTSYLGDTDEMPGLSAITLGLGALSNLSLSHVNHLAIDAALVQCPSLKSLTTHIFGDAELPRTLPPYVPSSGVRRTTPTRYFHPTPYFAESVRLSALQIDMHIFEAPTVAHFSKWPRMTLPTPGDRLPNVVNIPSDTTQFWGIEAYQD
ncbi:hypothetical protein PC9H_011832 [Pleurotus ostreatus]|uniref:Uncharacterized protein n=1 Tax=Pleurotus ostreatus TaxID=5322 RepID=A0A8H6ZMK6_PLEOS|nr:uncharacterized protein PC9H_011832 [Pleurotus ostreatus]KAF7421310.1 hypothetical protein PC9H_011832 [Pleurotus ostreatus]